MHKFAIGNSIDKILSFTKINSWRERTVFAVQSRCLLIKTSNGQVSFSSNVCLSCTTLFADISVFNLIVTCLLKGNINSYAAVGGRTKQNYKTVAKNDFKKNVALLLC